MGSISLRGHLNEIPLDDLYDALGSVEGKQLYQRLLAAIAYNHRVAQTELAEGHDTGWRMIYN